MDANRILSSFHGRQERKFAYKHLLMSCKSTFWACLALTFVKEHLACPDYICSGTSITINGLHQSSQRAQRHLQCMYPVVYRILYCKMTVLSVNTTNILICQ
jgi:hypothetical protein